ncbi:MAG TPA: hypothetical protein VNA20_08965 [Frankiaceae bacterium]|nr:hypothetical protein [Frankiaceae bacterium]
MRANLLATAVAAALAVSPAATAATPSEYAGGCRWRGVFVDVSDHSGEPDTYPVVVESRTAVYSGDPAANPVSATVTCTLRVGGEPRATASFSGTAVVAGSQTFSLVLRRDEWLEPCTTIDFTSDGTDTVAWCEGPRGGPPPQAVVAAAGELLRHVPGGDVRCAVTRAVEPIAPDVYQGLAVLPNGDVYVGDDQLVHCPPAAPAR